MRRRVDEPAGVNDRDLGDPDRDRDRDTDMHDLDDRSARPTDWYRISDARGNLEEQWTRGDDVSTEELRVAFRRYRSFFDRLLSV